MRDEEKTREAPNQPNLSYQTEAHVVSTSLNLPESPHQQGYIHGNPTGETGPSPQTSQPNRLGGFAFWEVEVSEEGDTRTGHERCNGVMTETSRGGSNLPKLSYLFGGR